MELALGNETFHLGFGKGIVILGRSLRKSDGLGSNNSSDDGVVVADKNLNWKDEVGAKENRKTVN